jgi:hypothetical protein
MFKKSMNKMKAVIKRLVIKRLKNVTERNMIFAGNVNLADYTTNRESQLDE